LGGTTQPVAARVTREVYAKIDNLAAEFGLSRSAMTSFILSAAIRHEDVVLGAFRRVQAASRERRNVAAGGHRVSSGPAATLGRSKQP